MSRRNLILLAIAVVVVGFYIFRPAQTDTTIKEQSLVKVVVAKHDIAPYGVISTDDLKEDRIPVEYVGAGAIVTWEDVRGKQLISAQDLRKGSVVRWSEVLEVPADWQVGQMLISSFYAPTERVVGGQVRPGHRIDLLVARPGAVETSESLWLAHDLWVVGVNQSSGVEIVRPTVASYGSALERETPQPTTGGLFGAATTSTTSGSAVRQQQGISNLVTVATDRETARMMSYYLGARLYDAWVYVRPEALASEGAQPGGTLQGLVFGDKNNSGRFDADEVGLAGVTLRMYDPAGVMKNVLTDDAGQFQFRDIVPGTYTLEEIDPAGFTSLTPNRRTIYVAEDQNIYVTFADAPGDGQDLGASGIAETVTVTQVITQSIYEQEPLIDLDLGVAAAEGGAITTLLSEGTNEVWAKITFVDSPEDLAYSVSVKRAGPDATENWVFDGQRQSQSDQWVKITPPNGAATFAGGLWMTMVRTGPEKTIRALSEWHVDSSTESATPAPGYGKSGGVLLGGH